MAVCVAFSFFFVDFFAVVIMSPSWYGTWYGIIRYTPGNVGTTVDNDSLGIKRLRAFGRHGEAIP